MKLNATRLLIIGVIFCSARASSYVESKINAFDGAAGDSFGYACDMDGDVIIVGAPFDDDNAANSGSAYIYRYSGSVWLLEEKLTADEKSYEDRFGSAVGVDGDWAMAGAHQKNSFQGAVYIFRKMSGDWVQQQVLTASDGDADDFFGEALDIDGNRAAISASNHDDKGAVYIFQFDGNAWNEEQKLTAPDGNSGDHFGKKGLCLEGDLLIIGAPNDSEPFSSSGSAYVFVYDGGSWSLQQKLTASDPGTNDFFGFSASAEGDAIFIGAYGVDDHTGAVYVFEQQGGLWTEQQKIYAGDYAFYDFFGYACDIHEGYLCVSSPQNFSRRGALYTFIFQAGSWVQQKKITASDAAADDSLGLGAFSIQNDRIVAGAPENDDNGPESGSAYVFSGFVYTPTPTLTPTHTLTPTFTPTSSPTSTPSPTSTASPTITNSPTLTPTAPSTATPTSTPTFFTFTPTPKPIPSLNKTGLTIILLFFCLIMSAELFPSKN